MIKYTKTNQNMSAEWEDDNFSSNYMCFSFKGQFIYLEFDLNTPGLATGASVRACVAGDTDPSSPSAVCTFLFFGMCEKLIYPMLIII